MLLTEQVLPHGLKLLGMEGTRIGMLKCQGWEIEWFGGLDDWDLRGAKAFRNIYNAWWHIYTFSFHQNDHTMYERHFWSHWSWKSYRIMDLLENLGILILWDALISWATPIVFVHQTHHFHISQSSERVQQNTPRFGKSFPGTPPWSSTFHQCSSVWGWPWGKTSATCGGAGNWGAPVTRLPTTLRKRRQVKLLKKVSKVESFGDL